MMFFFPVILLAILFDRPTRQALLSIKGLACVAIIAGLFIPNIVWNLNHDFATLSHTAENANLSGPLINPSELLSFWVDQLGVFGPLSFPLLIIALFNLRTFSVFGKWLCLLAIVPLIVISSQALLSRANANWAVSAYIAAPIVVAIFVLTRPKLLPFLKWGLIGQSAVMITLGLTLLSPPLTDMFGLSNSVKRLRAWPNTITRIEALYEAGYDGQEEKRETLEFGSDMDIPRPKKQESFRQSL